MPSNRLVSLIDAVSQAAMEVGIAQTPVSTVTASLDQDIVQMRSLLSAVAMEVLEEEPYNAILADGLWIIDAATGDFLEAFNADSNLIAFDRRLAINGIKWRFLKAKSLEFGEEMRDFVNRMNKLAARANARVLDLDLDEGRVQ